MTIRFYLKEEIGTLSELKERVGRISPGLKFVEKNSKNFAELEGSAIMSSFVPKRLCEELEQEIAGISVKGMDLEFRDGAKVHITHKSAVLGLSDRSFLIEGEEWGDVFKLYLALLNAKGSDIICMVGTLERSSVMYADNRTPAEMVDGEVTSMYATRNHQMLVPMVRRLQDLYKKRSFFTRMRIMLFGGPKDFFEDTLFSENDMIQIRKFLDTDYC